MVNNLLIVAWVALIIFIIGMRIYFHTKESRTKESILKAAESSGFTLMDESQVNMILQDIENLAPLLNRKILKAIKTGDKAVSERIAYFRNLSIKNAAMKTYNNFQVYIINGIIQSSRGAYEIDGFLFFIIKPFKLNTDKGFILFRGGDANTTTDTRFHTKLEYVEKLDDSIENFEKEFKIFYPGNDNPNIPISLQKKLMDKRNDYPLNHLMGVKMVFNKKALLIAISSTENSNKLTELISFAEDLGYEADS